MYHTCLYCNKDLGSNEVLELLPVGRRLAFDAAMGRLWVVCRSCARWNLVPFDTRLETIDACERIFRDTRMRFSTDNIGLARVTEGLELVRIGPALRPEFAAWRYGDRFASRRRRNIAIGATAGVALVGGAIGLQVLAGSVGGFQFILQGAIRGYEKHRIATRFVREDGGAAVTLSRADVKRSRLQRVEGAPPQWGLLVPARVGVRGRWTRGRRVADTIMLTGTDAVAALGHVLPVIAGTAGSRNQVRGAVGLVEEHITLDSLVARMRTQRTGAKPNLGRLGKLGPEPRLALEMLANEDSERRWLEGELRLLEHQWREAERLAAIADGLAIPDGIAEELAERVSR
ncbi:MAG: hypothetical protein ACREL5_08930 [Gemmatimonadales bacterium]